MITFQIKNSTRALTDFPYTISGSSSQGGSAESKRVETNTSTQCFELQYVLEAKDIAEFERRAEILRDVLLEDKTALSEKEMYLLKDIFNASQQLIKKNQETGTLMLLSLASLLESLIENDSYSSEISSIVRTLLKSPSKALRYAALDIIVAGLGIMPLANQLLKEARILLKNEGPGYVLDYLESL
jgi:hypothetical protein